MMRYNHLILRQSAQVLIFVCLLTLICNGNAIAQGIAPASGNAMASSRDASTPVNYFSGMPSISIPIFNYSSKDGLSLGMSLNYFAGGIRVDELPSTAGLGWNLSVGGAVTRTVRGVADDCPGVGYLFQTQLTDPRAKAYAYFNGCKDAEQDIFQFNFNGRSGTFYIGATGQIVLTSPSKMRIYCDNPMPEDFAIDPIECSIRSFTIVTEDGVKYFFDNIEYQNSSVMGCSMPSDKHLYKMRYGTAWYLSKISAPSKGSSEEISILYGQKLNQDVPSYYQTDTVRGGSNYHSDTSLYSYSSKTEVYSKVPVQIILPDSTKISLVYSSPGQYRYTNYPLLQRIKFSDSIFRYGYIFNWDTTGVGSSKRGFLNGLYRYTANAMMPGYSFSYSTPYYPASYSGDIVNFPNKKDHWGFYNGANNSKDYVPSVPSLYIGANREPTSDVIASTISSVKDPSGGITYYQFENNDVLPVTNSKQTISVNCQSNTSTAITLAKQQGSMYSFTLNFNSTFSRIGATPVTGPGLLVCSITSTDGLTTYATANISLTDLFNTNSAIFTTTIPNGNYLFKTSLGSGTSSAAALPVIVTWNNQSTGSGNATLAGGLRIKQIRHFDPLYNKIDTLTTYRYITPDGKSSGFNGTVPIYTFDFLHVINAPGSFVVQSTDKVIASSPVDPFNFGQASSVGYKRVEVIQGSLTHNLGRQVFEFNSADDNVAVVDPISFPYAPPVQMDWALGLPKRTLVYDSLGRLIQSTKNTYSFITPALSDSTKFRSIKYGSIGIYTNPGAGSSQNFTGQIYYPQVGRADLQSTLDTFWHPDNSMTISQKSMTYDTNYNIIKMTTDYDKTRGLTLEKRMYYAYNYTIGGDIGKLRDSSIFAPVSSEMWITGDGNPRIVSAEITDYVGGTSGFGGRRAAIKPFQTYALQTNKPVSENIIGIFNPAQLIRNTTYLVPQQKIDYDKFNPIQTTNSVSGVVNATIYGYGEKYPIAKITNALYAECSYTSFETLTPGNWSIPAFIPDTTQSITGRASYNLSAYGGITRSTLATDKIYIVSYWLKSGSSYAYFSGGGSPVLTDQQNGWDFYITTVTGITSLTISGIGWMDELRMYPKDANMATATFNELGQMTSSCDANNTIIYQQYDNVNRLKVIRDKDWNIIKKYEYPNDILSINTFPNWIPDSSVSNIPFKICETDTLGHNTGRQMRKESDTNNFSETYGGYRYVFYQNDLVTCPLYVAPPIDCGPDPKMKSVNGVCETGCRVNTASVYRKVLYGGSYVFKWVCTYHYHWTDGSNSEDYTEYNDSSCSMVSSCGLIES